MTDHKKDLSERSLSPTEIKMTDIPAERKVIVAMDGSHFSTFAFDWYIRNVHRKGDHVTIVHCYESVTPFTGHAPDPDVLLAFQQEEELKTKTTMDDLSRRLKASGIGGKCKSETGVPGPVIIKVAEEENAVMIVVGCRGLGTFRRTFLGSVSDYVMHHSHVPVVVCCLNERLCQTRALKEDEELKKTH